MTVTITTPGGQPLAHIHTKTMKATTWNTYATRGYTHDVSRDPNDQRSTGGVHLHQVRRTKGGWQKRILQSNGRHSASGPVEEVEAHEGIELFNKAKL